MRGKWHSQAVFSKRCATDCAEEQTSESEGSGLPMERPPTSPSAGGQELRCRGSTNPTQSSRQERHEGSHGRRAE